jgi:hypothetical protein
MILSVWISFGAPFYNAFMLVKQLQGAPEKGKGQTSQQYRNHLPNKKRCQQTGQSGEKQHPPAPTAQMIFHFGHHRMKQSDHKKGRKAQYKPLPVKLLKHSVHVHRHKNTKKKSAITQTGAFLHICHADNLLLIS